MSTAHAPLVVKLGGAAVDNAAGSAGLWRALAELHAADAVGVVLVHGGGAMVDARLQKLGVPSERIEGIRVTPPAMLDEVVATLAGSVNTAVIGQLMKAGAPAVGLTLADGFLTRCVQMQRGGVDFGRVGEVVGGDGRLVRTLLGAGFMPVISSIGVAEDGGALNVNADDGAAGVAAVTGARGLVLLTDVDGVMGAGGARIDTLTGDEAERLIGSGAIHGGMIPKVRGAVAAAGASGAPTLIASWKRPELLAGLASGAGVGTWIVASPVKSGAAL